MSNSIPQKRTCTFPNCDRPHAGHGLCSMHLKRLRKRDPLHRPLLSIEQRFWAKVDRSGDCWIWTGTKAGKGYGCFRIHSYQHVYAHRYSYELHFSPIPDGLVVCHRCDNPPCVRPDHLFLGTIKENALDMVAKGRSPKNNPSGEDNGMHVLTWDVVRSIRACYQAGGVSYTVLSARFGIHKSHIGKIIRHELWGGNQPVTPKSDGET